LTIAQVHKLADHKIGDRWGKDVRSMLFSDLYARYFLHLGIVPKYLTTVISEIRQKRRIYTCIPVFPRGIHETSSSFLNCVNEEVRRSLSGGNPSLSSNVGLFRVLLRMMLEQEFVELDEAFPLAGRPGSTTIRKLALQGHLFLVPAHRDNQEGFVITWPVVVLDALLDGRVDKVTYVSIESVVSFWQYELGGRRGSVPSHGLSSPVGCAGLQSNNCLSGVSLFPLLVRARFKGQGSSGRWIAIIVNSPQGQSSNQRPGA